MTLDERMGASIFWRNLILRCSAEARPRRMFKQDYLGRILRGSLRSHLRMRGAEGGLRDEVAFQITTTGSPSMSKIGSMPRPGASEAVMKPLTRLGAPRAMSTVP